MLRSANLLSIRGNDRASWEHFRELFGITGSASSYFESLKMKNFKNSKDFFDVALRYLLKPYLPTAASTFRTYNQNATAKFNEFMDPEYPRPTKAEKAHDEKKDENAGIGLCDQLQPCGGECP